jgi:hypothetical protein
MTTYPAISRYRTKWFGGYARYLFIGLAPSLAAVEGQGERERLAQVIWIGG